MFKLYLRNLTLRMITLQALFLLLKTLVNNELDIVHIDSFVF